VRFSRGKWTLYYNDKEQSSMPGPGAQRTLEAQAAFLNERRATPSKATCRADGLRMNQEEAIAGTPDMFADLVFQPKPRPPGDSLT
jgi:hypothetical protein